MTADELDTLCHRASLALGLEDPYALGKGHTVTHHGVHLEVQHRPPREHFLLLAEIGLFDGEQRAQVHERLLALQLSTADHPNLRFGFHPVRHTTLLCLTAQPPAQGDASAWLAGLLEQIAHQVGEWRQSLHTSPGAPDPIAALTAQLQPAMRA